MAKRRSSRKKKKKFSIERLIYFSIVAFAVIDTIQEEYPGLLSLLVSWTVIVLIIVGISYILYKNGGYRLSFASNRLKTSLINEVDSMDGLEFEHFLKPLFEAKGFHAKVTQGSGDFGADLKLTKQGRTTVVQAKRYSNSIGVSAIQQVVSAKAVYKAQDAIVVTNQFYTPAAKKLAKVNRVKLIDRNELKDMITDYHSTSSSTVLCRILNPFGLRLDRD
ncbi:MULTISPECIES: restriction endonuclease [Bacillaceae]|uniref:Restriction endonuclease n=1 Tax=Evansella alkalicola TaxID=745819 RepID=A0ABS6JVS4_9BACI|nr:MULTISPECIES: restriction endonuclease [Bacillaceae]MBU9721347.1 restriction endonuclease [Bacillus alkalicola]